MYWHNDSQSLRWKNEGEIDPDSGRRVSGTEDAERVLLESLRACVGNDRVARAGKVARINILLRVGGNDFGRV